MMKTPVVLMPIDLAIRELNSKLVVASALAARGLSVVVGRKAELSHIARHSGPLVWLGKELFSEVPGSLKNTTADRLIENGSAIVYVQDEGGMFQSISWNEQVLEKHQIEAMRSRKVDRLSVWGRRQGEVIAESAPELAESIRVTGSARFDLCSARYAWLDRPAVDSIRERFGAYTLICTRFGSVAHSDGVDHWFRQRLGRAKWSPNARSIDRWLAKWRRDVHDFAEFVVLVRQMADSFPERRFILRPHPSESLDFYRNATLHLPNVDVVREGNITAWVRGADLVVHSNCTTGIEAVLAGRPVINFLPGGDRAGLDVEVAREAGTIVNDVATALATAGAMLAGERAPQVWSDHALDVLNNLRSDALPLLVDEVTSTVDQRGIGPATLSMPPHSITTAARNLVRRAFGRGGPRPAAPIKFEAMNGPYVEWVIDGCRREGIGGGRISQVSNGFAIIEP